MGKIYKSSKGRIIDMDALRKASEQSTAVGNMKVNGRGDRLGPGGVVRETVNSRARKLHKENPRAMREISLKTQDSDKEPVENIKKNMPQKKKKTQAKSSEQSKTNTIDKRLEREDEDGNIIIEESNKEQDDVDES